MALLGLFAVFCCILLNTPLWMGGIEPLRIGDLFFPVAWLRALLFRPVSLTVWLFGALWLFWW